MCKSFEKIIIENSKLLEEIRKIREEDLDNLFSLWDKAQKNLESHGINVHVLGHEEALRLIDELIDEPLVVKSKSNISKELCLKEHLRKRSIEVIETDFGDHISDLLGYESSHPILPLYGLDFERIKELLNEKGINIATEEELKNYVVKRVKEAIFKSNIGITGANFISSDGRIFLIENEGNISLVSRLPRVHIVLASFEKITKDYETGIKLSVAQTLFSTERPYTSYLNVISAPSSSKDIPNKTLKGLYGAKEVHLIVIDGNRSKIYDSEFKEVLKCINCGSCSRFCFVHCKERQGFEHPGIKGIAYALYRRPWDEIAEKVYNCSLCGLCEHVCPVAIRWTDVIRVIRSKVLAMGLGPKSLYEMKDRIMKTNVPVVLDEKQDDFEFYCC